MPDTQQPPTSDNTASADRAAFGQRLSRSNTFLIRRLPSGELELWHRSSTREVIRTPIHQNDQGVYLDTDLWADFNRTLRYADLATLRRELSRVLQDTSYPSDLHPLTTQASAALDAWERAAPPGERQDRRRAVSWIHASSSGSSVDLSSLDTLSSLPPLPASVRELKLGRGVRFHMDNETHARVESVSSYPLLTRIASLPEGLHILELSGCRNLTELPDPLPAGLAHLSLLDASALTRLPDLPQVIDLDLKGCSSLIELPELSPNLVSLELGGCTSLRGLPAQRPPRLTILDVSGCRALTTLPAWVNELSYFIGPAVEPARREQGTREPLTHSAREPLAMLRLDHHFNHLMAEQPHEAWFRRAGRSEQDIARLRHDWERLRGENGHADFQILLRRLGELGGRSETVKALPQTVAAVIAEVAQAPADSRKLILAAAEGAGADCHDRVLTCFNDVQAQVEASRLQRSGAGESALLDLASRLFRQTLLDEATTQVIRRQWQQRRRAANSTNDGPNTREALEVQLALREHLGAELDLPFQAYGMHTTEQLTLLNTSDLEFAREQVQRAFVEEHRLAAGLAQQAMWRRYLEQQPGVAAALKAVSAPFEQQMADLDDRLALPADAPDALGSEAYLTQANSLRDQREAAISAQLQQASNARLTHHTTGYRQRLESLLQRVRAYLRASPDSGRVPALSTLDQQLSARLQALSAVADRSPAEQLQARYTQTELFSVDTLEQQAAVRGKPRGKSYQAILRELAALDAAPDVGAHERLTSWKQVRAGDAQSFVRQGHQLGAEVRHVPQAIWLDNDPATVRRGLCTGLALAWALEPAAATLLDNLFSTAAHPTDPAALQFRQAIEQLHQAANLGAAGAPLAAITNWDQAVDHLAAQSGERALLIHVGNHSVALAARPEAHVTQFAFFDPNAGVWHRITDSARFKTALNNHFTAERLQQYASDGQISVVRVQTPPPASQPAWQRARTPLELSVTRLIRQDQQQGALRIGAQRVGRAELFRLGATQHGRVIQPDTDWLDPTALRLPARSTAGQRALLVSGSGLRLYGAWRTLSGAMDNTRQGRMHDAAIDLGGFAAEFAGEATERGAARLGDFLQHTLAGVRSGTASTGRALGRSLARGAGIAGNLLTLPFDLYAAITGFSRAQQSHADERQNALFQGGMATAGAVTGLSLAIAAAAGASSALLGPIGLGLGVALLAAGQIYAAVRQVQEVQQWIELSAGERLALGLRAAVGLGADLETRRRVQHVRYEEQLRQDARRLLASDARQALATILYPAPVTHARALNGSCDAQHAHEHLALADTEAPLPTTIFTPEGQYTLQPPVLPQQGCPLNPAHRHSPRHGNEIFVDATDDQVAYADSNDALRTVHAGPAGGNGPLLGNAGDDLFSLNIALDPERGQRYRFDGAGGNDSLLIETDFSATEYDGHFIDLETGTLALIRPNGQLPSVGALSGITNLLARAGASRHRLYGNAQANLLTGAGDDHLYGRGGDDTFSLAGRARADGGDGNDLYLIEDLKTGERVTLSDSGDDGEHNQIYLGMNAEQLRRAHLSDRTLVLEFAAGGQLVLENLYEEQGSIWRPRPARWNLLSQDGQMLNLALPATLNANQQLEIDWQAQPERLLALLAHPGVQRLARIQREREKAVMFNFGNGNDTLAGAPERKNLFVLGSGNKTVTGGARDDVFTLNAAPRFAASGIADYDPASRKTQAQRIGDYRYELNGNAGNDSLQIETDLTDSGFIGYSIDLAQQRIALLRTDNGPLRELGHISQIENLIASGSPASANSHHELFGNEQANLLIGAGHDRLEGRGGDDVLRVCGQARAFGGDGNDTLQVADRAFADGGAGRDVYLVDAIRTDDRITLQDSVADDGNDSLVRFSDDVMQISEWRVEQNDLVLSMASGGSLTIRDVYQTVNGQRVLSAANWRLVTRDGFVLAPELAATLPADPVADNWRITTTWLPSADATHAPGQGIDLNLATRTLAPCSGLPAQWIRPPRASTVLGARYRLIGDGTAFDDTLTACTDNGVVRGRAGDDTLIAAHPGSLLRGDEGADRYRLDLRAANDTGEAWYLDNQAEDAEVDTLELTGELTRARLALERVDDDLHLSAAAPDAHSAVPLPAARVVLFDYYREVRQRHLALELRTPAGEVATRIGASELEQWALSEQTPVYQGTSEDHARVERLNQALAGFGAGNDQGANLIRPTRETQPATLLAPAA